MTKILVSSIVIFLVCCHVQSQESANDVLTGVTIKRKPFAYEEDDKIKGLAVDMMDMIGEKVGFNYTLYWSPDGKYGHVDSDGNVTGMVGEVYNNRADFAVADLTVTETREHFIDFTEPFMIDQLAVLVKRGTFDDLKTLEDLVKKNDESDDVKPVVFGSMNGSTTYNYLKNSEDPIIKKMFDSIKPASLVKDLAKGVERVLEEPGYALIVESTFGENSMIENCNLTMLVDIRQLHPRKYAIGLPNESPKKEIFNKAIKELVSEGKIEELRKKYLSNNCTKSSV